MTRILPAIALMLLCGPLFADEKDRPKDPPGKVEKIDGTVDRSLTGFVDKVEARDEASGALTLRTGDKLPLYRLQIDDKTKFLTNRGEPLEGGLKSRLLPRAEVRVVFVDVQPKGEKSNQPDTHVCRVVQIINAGK